MLKIDFSELNSTPQFFGNSDDLLSGISAAPTFPIPHTNDVRCLFLLVLPLLFCFLACSMLFCCAF